MKLWIISSHRLTEHGHVLLAVEIPVSPVGPVAMHCGILLIIICWLRAEGVDHTNVAPRQKKQKCICTSTSNLLIFQLICSHIPFHRRKRCVHISRNVSTLQYMFPYKRENCLIPKAEKVFFFPCNTMKASSKIKSTTAVDHLTCNAQIKWTTAVVLLIFMSSEAIW